MENVLKDTEAGRVPRKVSESETVIDPKLKAIWETAPGIRGILSSVDHKRIGIRYIVTAFVFLIAGGIEALIMRLQLAHSDLKILSPEAYNQLFTMHGFTMIFLYAGPVLSGFSNYLWPLLLGSRDMAFPRLNACRIGFSCSPGLFLYASFPLGLRPMPAGSTTRRSRGRTTTRDPILISICWD
jgi:hypothetical protein